MEVIRKVRRSGEDSDRIWNNYLSISDGNEAIAFLRAKVINTLASEAADVFVRNEETILAGTYNNTLIDEIQDRCEALSTVRDISVKKIYGHDTVLQIELAGYNVMSELLQLFVPALLRTRPTHKDGKILKLFPYQYTEFEEATTGYGKVLSALDHLSSMTDEYATEIYRRLKGVVIPGHG